MTSAEHKIAGFSSTGSSPLAFAGDIWPWIVVTSGLGLSAVWIAAVGYGVFQLVRFVL
jgi:hypothetical protein